MCDDKQWTCYSATKYKWPLRVSQKLKELSFYLLERLHSHESGILNQNLYFILFSQLNSIDIVFSSLLFLPSV